METIESLKRENELLRELVKAKDALIKELNLKAFTPHISTGLANTILTSSGWKMDYGPACEAPTGINGPTY